MARPKAMLGATATVPKVDGSIGGDKRIFSMYIFHYSCLFLNILDMLHKKIRMLNLFLNYWLRGKLMCFQILGYWTGRARQWNWTVIHYVLQKKLYNLVPDVCHHFQIAEMKVYKTYEGHIIQFCCFEAQKASWKNKDWTSPKFLHCTDCFGLCPLSQRSEVQKFQDQFHWKENLILYNFSRNRDLWIRTFPTSNLARNVWVGRNSMQKRKLSSLLQG